MDPRGQLEDQLEGEEAPLGGVLAYEDVALKRKSGPITKLLYSERLSFLGNKRTLIRPKKLHMFIKDATHITVDITTITYY